MPRSTPITNELVTKSIGFDAFARWQGGDILVQWRCVNCSIVFHTPGIYGDDDFYARLSQYPWYYESEKWEFDVALDLVQDGEFDFSLRQLTILFTIYLEDPPHTVRGLAGKLKVTKPVITRALDTMGQRDLLKRRRDEVDRVLQLRFRH